MFTNLEAYAALEDQTFPLTIDCRSSKGNVAKLVTPEFLEVYGRDSRQILCSFDDLEVGAHVFTMTINFDFTTLAYLPVTYTSEQAKRQVVLDQKDFFERHAKNSESARYLWSMQGPATIGMGSDKQPLVGERLIVSFTAHNEWDGSIAQPKDLVLLSPKWARLERVSDKPKFIQQKCSDLDKLYAKGCDDKLQNVYRISLPNKPIKTFKTYHAHFIVDNPASILTQTPYVQTTFYTIFNYAYEFQKKTRAITVKGPEI